MIRVLVNGEWVEQAPQDGDRVREYLNVGTPTEHFREYVYKSPAVSTVYPVINRTVTVNGSPANLTLSGGYAANIGDTVQIDGELQGGESVSYPGAVIKMPITRHADGKPTDDEIYFTASIVDGVVSASGQPPRSGDWKVLNTRVNKALERMNAGWQMESDDITVLV